jgi:hypothetical protein
MGSIVGIHLNNSGNTYLSNAPVTITTSTTSGGVAGGSGTGAVIKYVGETSPSGPGNFISRYVTKSTMMSSSVEAKDLKIYLTAAQPPGTRVWVYIKVRNSDDPESFAAKNWSLARRMQSHSEEVTPTSVVFREIRFMGAGDGEFPLAYNTFNTFNEFAVKIVMQSADPLVVPVISNFRAIAVE